MSASIGQCFERYALTKRSKSELRKALRKLRREHVEAQPDAIRALLFHRPPAPVLDTISPNAVIGLYHAMPFEAPAAGYAKFFLDRGNPIALPWFETRESPMRFRVYTDPFDDHDLEVGPFGMLQPTQVADEIVPDVLFVPLVGFTENGDRLGQGAGHYDRWFSEHREARGIGLAWDMQLCVSVPTEPHDVALHSIVTPTRFYGVK